MTFDYIQDSAQDFARLAYEPYRFMGYKLFDFVYLVVNKQRQHFPYFDEYAYLMELLSFTTFTSEEIKMIFGDEVRDLVVCCTPIKRGGLITSVDPINMAKLRCLKENFHERYMHWEKIQALLLSRDLVILEEMQLQYGSILPWDQILPLSFQTEDHISFDWAFYSTLYNANPHLLSQMQGYLLQAGVY